MTSIFETILILEAAIGAIYFTFFLNYVSQHYRGQVIPTSESKLLFITMLYIFSFITILCIFLYFTYIPEYENFILDLKIIGAFIAALWFTMILIFLQGIAIYKKL